MVEGRADASGLADGCGKTVVLAKVAEDQVEHGGRVLIMAHRGELLDQAADKVKQVTELTVHMKAGASSLAAGCQLPLAPSSHFARKNGCNNSSGLLLLCDC